MEEGTIFWLVGEFECTLVLSSISEADLSAPAPAPAPAKTRYSSQVFTVDFFSRDLYFNFVGNPLLFYSNE